MSRRSRALVLLVAAAACALLAAAVAGRYRARVEARYGPLRPVLVATAELTGGRPIDPQRAGAALAVRRVPASFIPPGALTRAEDAVGQAPAATVPAGSYVLSAQLAAPQPARPRARPPRTAGLRPVEVAVAGASALTVGGSPEGGRVDVVVARQAGLGRSAHARIAATGVRLLALRGPATPGEPWSATLAVSEPEALELIGAQSAGREIRLLPRG